jgi:hypothetical protein
MTEEHGTSDNEAVHKFNPLLLVERLLSLSLPNRSHEDTNILGCNAGERQIESTEYNENTRKSITRRNQSFELGALCLHALSC